MRLDQIHEEKLRERIIHINRVSKVVRGGRRFSFSALVVVGDGIGYVGVGLGKANEVPEAVRKAGEQGKKGGFQIPLYSKTIPHDVVGHFGSAKVYLKPASRGTGVIASGVVRAIVECAGVWDIRAKCIGSSNPYNVARAVIDGFRKLRGAREVANKRNKQVEDVYLDGSLFPVGQESEKPSIVEAKS